MARKRKSREEIIMEHPNNIWAIREEKGIDPETLAGMIGVSEVHLYRIEMGQQPLSKKRIQQFAKCLGVNENTILGDDKNKTIAISAVVRSMGLVEFFNPELQRGSAMRVEIPNYINHETAVALRLENAEALSYNENYVPIYDEWIKGVPAEFIGLPCAVEIACDLPHVYAGKTFIREIHKSLRIGFYDLVPLNPNNAVIKNIQVERSAVIKDFRLRMPSITR